MNDSDKLKYFNDGLKFGYDQAKADIISDIEAKMALFQLSIDDNRDATESKIRLSELKAVLVMIKTTKFKVQ